jgi:AcrR family transcriptional regulator
MGAPHKEGLVAARREPVQRRSRERVEQMLEAASELLAQGGVESLTTRALAEYTGIPVGTIYRYFSNRDEIIAAYLDHEMAVIEEAVATALRELERVTFRSMLEAAALAHLRHHQAHPEGVPVWFGGRANAAVVERVAELDRRVAVAFRAAVRGSGMLAGAPDFVSELLVRLFDRVFEFVFSQRRTAREQEEIVRAFVDMAATHMERYATPTGVTGVPLVDFLPALQRESSRRPPPEPGLKNRT